MLWILWILTQLNNGMTLILSSFLCYTCCLGCHIDLLSVSCHIDFLYVSGPTTTIQTFIVDALKQQRLPALSRISLNYGEIR